MSDPNINDFSERAAPSKIDNAWRALAEEKKGKKGERNNSEIRHDSESTEDSGIKPKPGSRRHKSRSRIRSQQFGPGVWD